MTVLSVGISIGATAGLVAMAGPFEDREDGLSGLVHTRELRGRQLVELSVL